MAKWKFEREKPGDITPDIPVAMNEGMRFEIRKGDRAIGFGTVGAITQ